MREKLTLNILMMAATVLCAAMAQDGLRMEQLTADGDSSTVAQQIAPMLGSESCDTSSFLRLKGEMCAEHCRKDEDKDLQCIECLHQARMAGFR